MRVSYTSFLIGALAARQATATWNVHAQPYSSPDNTDNQCYDQQGSGFDWGSLGFGNFNSYSGFSFSGWTCEKSFDSLSKRGHSKSGFQDKCIKGSISKGSSSGPSISCGSHSFSIEEFQITVDIETDVEFHYVMGDNSICKQTASCSRSGTTVKNTQCGGAKSVTFHIPDHGKQSSCNIGIHKIGFNCNRHTSSVAAASSTPAQYSSPPAVYSTPAAYSSPPAYSSPAPYSSPARYSSPAPIYYNTSVSSSAAAYSTPPAYTPPAYTPPAYSSPAQYSSPAAYSSVAVYSSAAASSTSSSSSSCSNSASAPDILPRCMNTWLSASKSKSKCKDNTDYSCYCQDSSFVAQIYDCISAWGDDVLVVSEAISFFVGVCADFVPKNPGIISNCPSTVTLAPTYGTTSTCSQTAPATYFPTTTAYVTTLTVTQTVTVPCTISTGESSGYTISGSSTVSTYSTTVTVPQVAFTTNTVTVSGSSYSQSVYVVPGTPAPAPAYATPTAFGTVTVPNASATSSLAAFTGAAVKVGAGSLSGAAFAAALAALAL